MVSRDGTYTQTLTSSPHRGTGGLGHPTPQVPAPGPYRLWPRGPGCIMAVSGEVEVLRCPLLLTFLTGGLGPTPGQGEGKQAWVPITNTGAFIIQFTLRRGPGPGRAKGDVRAMCQGWGIPESPKLKKPGQTPCWATRQRGREDRKGGNDRAHKVRARKIGGHSSQGVLSPAPSLPGPCLLRGKICSRFASSRKSSEFNCTQLWSAQSILSTPFLHHIFL